MEIFVHRNGDDFGPYTKENILDFAKEGRIEPTDLVWNEGYSNWVTYNTWIKNESEPIPSENWLTPKMALAGLAAGLALAGIIAAAHQQFLDFHNIFF